MSTVGLDVGLEDGRHRLPTFIATLRRYFQYLHPLPTTPCHDLSEDTFFSNCTVIFPYIARLQHSPDFLTDARTSASLGVPVPSKLF